MKKLLFYFTILLSPALQAQKKLPEVFLTKNFTIHFISPEPIQYVDISNKALSGDLALKNVLRIRIKDSVTKFDGAVITIAGETFIAQYRVVSGYTCPETEININPTSMSPLDISGIGFSQNQLKTMALNLIAKRKGRGMEKASSFGLTGLLNHTYTAGDYIFVDISYKNKTNLKYDIEDLRFSIDDKKINKASNIQSLELKPTLILFNTPAFRKYYRNIFVFKKISFPGNKVLTAELSEKKVSGRTLTLKISYQDVLNADLLPN